MKTKGSSKVGRLSAANYLTLPCPKDKSQEWIPDHKVPGLFLVVLPSDQRTWYINKKRNGQRHCFAFADARVLSLSGARDRAQKLLGELSSGIDIAAERRRGQIRGITVKEAVEGYITDHVNLKPLTMRDYRAMIARHASDWERRPLAEITGDMLIARHRKVGATNRAGANYLVRIIRALWNWAAVDDPKTFSANPAKAVGAKKAWFNIERKRTRLAPHEFAPWFRAVDAGDPEAADFLRTLLLLGLRVGEVSKLCAQHVDIKGATLKIEDAKAGSRTAWLGTHSHALLARLKAQADAGGPLFQYRDQYQTALRKRLRKANAQAEVTDVTFHCLRRTYASVLEQLGAPYVCIKVLLGHKLPKADVTAGYIIPTEDLLRHWQQKAEDYIIARSRDPAEVVVPFPAKPKRRKAAV